MSRIRVGNSFFIAATFEERYAAELRDRIVAYLVVGIGMVASLIMDSAVAFIIVVPTSIALLIAANGFLFLTRGQSIGMALARLRLIDVATGLPPRLRGMGSRAVLAAINPYPMVAVWSRQDRRAWYERRSGTAIVRT